MYDRCVVQTLMHDWCVVLAVMYYRYVVQTVMHHWCVVQTDARLVCGAD